MKTTGILNAQSTDGQSGTDIKNNSLSFERVEIENTPFMGIYEEGKGWSLVLGLNKLTMPVETKEELLEIVNRPDWNLIIDVVILATKLTMEELKGEKNNG